jgi:predicted transcriptional regulator YheO
MLPLVEAISRTVGDNCEIVLHDFSDLENSVVAIANGHVTGRTLGSGMLSKGLEAYLNREYEESMIKYKNIIGAGRTLKSSTIFVKDDEENVIGAMCINIDVTDLLLANKAIHNLVKTEDLEATAASEQNKFHVSEILQRVVDEVFKQINKPVAYLSKADKLQIVEQLEDRGAFLIKGAVEHVADLLCVSRYTVYNYIEEVKEQKNGSDL